MGRPSVEFCRRLRERVGGMEHAHLKAPCAVCSNPFPVTKLVTDPRGAVCFECAVFSQQETK